MNNRWSCSKTNKVMSRAQKFTSQGNWTHVMSMKIMSRVDSTYVTNGLIPCHERTQPMSSTDSTHVTHGLNPCHERTEPMSPAENPCRERKNPCHQRIERMSWAEHPCHTRIKTTRGEKIKSHVGKNKSRADKIKSLSGKISQEGQ